MVFPQPRTGRRTRPISAPLSAVVALALAVLLSACSAAAAGLNSFQSPDGRYAFL
ncbi:MAG: hypothetical protein RLZZ589_980, partial [Cyanobacteriota bacterium]